MDCVDPGLLRVNGDIHESPSTASCKSNKNDTLRTLMASAKLINEISPVSLNDCSSSPRSNKLHKWEHSRAPSGTRNRRTDSDADDIIAQASMRSSVWDTKSLEAATTLMEKKVCVCVIL